MITAVTYITLVAFLGAAEGYHWPYYYGPFYVPRGIHGVLPTRNFRNTIVEVAEKKGFSTFVSLVRKAGLASTLAIGGPLTVFAPTNEAFAALSNETLVELQTKPKLLKKILKGHMIRGTVFSQSLSDKLKIKSLAGTNLTFRIDGRDASVNGSNFVQRDVKTSNGVVHIIDKVLMPEKEARKTIVDVAVENGLSTLASYFQQAGLASTLANDGPLTIFAPTNEAFDDLPNTTVNQFQSDSEFLRRVLLGHIIRGDLFADNFSNNLEVNSLASNRLNFNVFETGASVNGANIVTTDVKASNGIVHAIDKVLLPNLEENNDRKT